MPKQAAIQNFIRFHAHTSHHFSHWRQNLLPTLL